MFKSKLKSREEEIIEIEKEIAELSSPFGPYAGNMLRDEYIKDVQSRLKIAEKERLFLIDERNGWKAKIFWDVIVPLITSVVTSVTVAYLVLKFGLN